MELLGFFDIPIVLLLKTTPGVWSACDIFLCLCAGPPSKSSVFSFSDDPVVFFSFILLIIAHHISWFWYVKPSLHLLQHYILFSFISCKIRFIVSLLKLTQWEPWETGLYDMFSHLSFLVLLSVWMELSLSTFICLFVLSFYLDFLGVEFTWPTCRVCFLNLDNLYPWSFSCVSVWLLVPNL